MQSVSHIFGGEAKAKIIRLLVFNPSLTFPSAEVALRAKVSTGTARRELGILTKAGLIKRRIKGYVLDSSYLHLPTVKDFLTAVTPITNKEIIKRISRAGNIKLILIAGVFFHDPDARVDILIAGDYLKQSKLLSIMSSIEAELGKELRYAAFETVDFQYRLSIYDKLIRDILDSRHEKILNKLGI